MRITYVIQRYGREVVGGGESFCRQFATRLAARGHEVTVLTSRVLDIHSMAFHYDEGTEVIDGVTVHRLPGHAPCDEHIVQVLRRVAYANPNSNPDIHYAWQRAMGPLLPTLRDWIGEHRKRIDVLVPVTQFYFPANEAIIAAAKLGLPTLFHPLAHQDRSLQLSFFDRTFGAVSAFGFLTEEEEALVRRRFGSAQPSLVHGVGVDLAPPIDDEGADALGLPDRPYLVFVGRTENHKLGDAIDYMARFRARHGRRVDLVTVGPTMAWLEQVPDVLRAGFQPDGVRNAVIQRSLGLVMPSPFESFSMVLTEAWALGRPALVNGQCTALRGQAERSGGAFSYDDYDQFEAGLLRLLDEPGTAGRLGAAGRAYVEARYDWDDVIDRYEDLLARVAGKPSPAGRRGRPARAAAARASAPNAAAAAPTVPAERPVATAPTAATGPVAEPAPAPGPVAVLVVADGTAVELLDVLEQLEGRTLDGAPFHVLFDAGRVGDDVADLLGRLEDVSIAATPDSPCQADELVGVLRQHGYRYLVRMAGPVRLPARWWAALGAAVDDGGPAGIVAGEGRAEALDLATLEAAGAALLDDAWAAVAFRPVALDVVAAG